jgi:hypothetical protein
MFPGSYSVPGNLSGGSSVTTDTRSSGSSAGVRSEKHHRIELCGKAGVEGVAAGFQQRPGAGGRPRGRADEAVQEDEARAALASAHTDLVQAAGDLVARIAERFLEVAGADTDRRDRAARWPEREGEASCRARPARRAARPAWPPPRAVPGPIR